MYTFKRARELAAGRQPTSTDIASLAQAWNDRILSGIGNVAWRMTMYWLNAWRLVRNPYNTLYPSQSEFHEFYQHIDPETGFTWPVMAPGEPEGANLASPMMQYVHGVEDLPGEADRLAVFPMTIGNLPPSNVNELWELGKMQRGAYDPETGAQNVPAFDAAQQFFLIATPYFSPHGKSYGGFFPMPTELASDCGVGDETGLGVPSLQIKFTALRTDVSTAGFHGSLSYDGEGRPVITYAGTCPCWTTNYGAGHVAWIGRWPFAAYVAVGTGSGCTYNYDRFATADWIEGPYTGAARLERTDGGQLQRAMWAYAADYRGTSAQRGGHGLFGQLGMHSAGDDTFDVREVALSNQEHLTRQWPLAPARGVLIDPETMIAVYPRAEWSAEIALPVNAPGRLVHYGANGFQHDYTAGFVCAGVFARGTGLRGPTKVEWLSGDQVFATVTLQPDADGFAEQIEWLDAVVVPEPLTMRLPEGAQFIDGGGAIAAEANELLEYLPQYWDIAMLARLASTDGAPLYQAGVDGRGLDTPNAKQLSDDLLWSGSLWNRKLAAAVRGTIEWVNDNPVLDTARRLSRDHARIMRRQQLVAYEVVDGKSVLYFHRFAFGMDNTQVDPFHAIAPPLAPVATGDLVEGETYIVRGAAGAYVVYQGVRVGVDGTFEASTEREYQEVGGAWVYVHDGIRHAALKGGWTNRWVFSFETKCYSPSPSSIWKPDAYSDFFPFCQRCLFYGGNIPSAQFRRHVGYQYGVELGGDFQPVVLPARVQATMLAPEAPDAMIYSLGSNQTYATEAFRRSCQIYDPPLEIESCVVDDASTHQIVKVTLSGRLRSHPDAPESVAKDPMSWSAAEVQQLRNEYAVDPSINEDYRTPDNAIREYVRHMADPSYQCSRKTGDAGAASSIFSLPDTPYGSCYPTFHFCRLMSEPYDDGNDRQQPHDARMTIDALLHAEVLTRAGCEGFVDGQTTAEMVCTYANGGLYDYRFETLCFQAFSGRDMGVLDPETRPDQPAGFGPFPNTEIQPEVYNRLVSAVNLLTRARLDVPVGFRWRTVQYEAERPVTTTPYGYIRSWLDGAGSPSGWGEALASVWVDFPLTYIVGASRNTWLTGGPPHQLNTSRIDIDYQAQIDPNWVYCVPQTILDMIDVGQTGFVAVQELTVQTWKRQVNPASGDTCDGSYYEDALGNRMEWVPDVDSYSSACVVVSSGTLVAPGIPAMDYSHCVAVPEQHNTGVAYHDLTLAGDRMAFIEVPLRD